MSEDSQMVMPRILKLWIDYTDPKHPKGIEKIEYCAPGAANFTTTIARISELEKVRPYIPGSEDIAAKIANMRWNHFKPAIEAWRKGQEAPVSGTPLAVWAGLTQEQADVLRMSGIRTVEEVANASDSIISTVRMPGVRDIRENARKFLASSDRNKITAELAQKDQQIASMSEQLEEMRQIVLEMQKAQEPKRRGRPPQEAKEEAAA